MSDMFKENNVKVAHGIRGSVMEACDMLRSSKHNDIADIVGKVKTKLAELDNISEGEIQGDPVAVLAEINALAHEGASLQVKKDEGLAYFLFKDYLNDADEYLKDWSA